MYYEENAPDVNPAIELGRSGPQLRAAALLLSLLPAWATAADGLPPPAAPAAGTLEISGSLHGQPFWAHLLPPDAKFGGKRVLQLVYTPPTPETLAGAHLVDCPFVLLDDQLRVLAWNGRDSLSNAQYDPKAGAYRVTREVMVKQGEDERPVPEDRTILGQPGWELRLAPVLLALGWSATTTAQVRAVDLFGPRHGEALQVSWAEGKVLVGGLAWTAEADAEGRLRRLTDAQGVVVVEVKARSAGGKPDAKPAGP
jgi:hypothetical protein